MKKETVTVSMDAEKLRATKRYMGKKAADLEQELCDQLQRLYEKYVPANVREYIDEGDEDAPAPPKRQREKSGTAAVSGREAYSDEQQRNRPVD